MSTPPNHSTLSATAVIVAAGQGTRMGPGIDKIFLDLCGKPVVAWAWSTFDSSPCISDIVLVVRDGMQDHFHEMAKSLNLTKAWTLVPGGKERQDSVWNGLNAIPDSSRLVAIHDGARPCVTHEIIQKTLEAADLCGAAVAAQTLAAEVKVGLSGHSRSLLSVHRMRVWPSVRSLRSASMSGWRARKLALRMISSNSLTQGGGPFPWEGSI